ncbi:hypothetical protein [Alkalibacterium thalassium]|uniref:Uncharacterized protein n=1 Tax=Alkalibacterium thalassium TaxID=426701 RepID=A0A1G8V6V9_9LACT|nr:hypothetical protein [Alkalibacterium thalassium]SDJ61876.1 hypothetical protein SAMN04488098_100172 [Alkalibacterium thalassium]
MSDKHCPYCGQEETEENCGEAQAARKYICQVCDQSFGGTKDSPELHCDEVYFSHGGFFSGNQSLRIEERDGYADLTVSSPFSETEGGDVRFRIMLCEWMVIKTTLFYDLFVMDWQEAYNDPTILDGTQWELKLTFDDRESVKSVGSNAFPALYDDLLELFTPYFDQGAFERD